MFLTQDEMRELTGYVKPLLQKRWLTSRGWMYEENAAGHPKVLRALAEKRMGLAPDAAPKRRTGPNLGAIL